jgi:hypothetical protein
LCLARILRLSKHINGGAKETKKEGEKKEKEGEGEV